MKMEQTECFETLAYKIQMPGNYPEESIQHSEQREFEIENLMSIRYWPRFEGLVESHIK